jgi:hypothetical protein
MIIAWSLRNKSLILSGWLLTNHNFLIVRNHETSWTIISNHSQSLSTTPIH